MTPRRAPKRTGPLRPPARPTSRIEEDDDGEVTAVGGGERLQKALANAGYGSRRAIEELIAAGRITVNGRTAILGQRVRASDRVTVNGAPVHAPRGPRETVVLAYNKPAGEIVSQKDPEGRPSVFRAIPKPRRGRWIAIGRLDFNSSGLLLFTTDGELAARLQHPRHEIERVYAVRVAGQLSMDNRTRLLEGLPLEDGVARFKALEDAGGEGSNHWYRVVLQEGRNREVRRMFEAVGHSVSRLLRTRYGPVDLPRDLPRGKSRPVTGATLTKLLASVGIDLPTPARDARPAGRPRRIVGS